MQDGINGQVIDNQNPEQMAQAIRRIRQQDFSRPEHRAAIRSSVPAEYTLDCMVDQILGVYESAVQGPARVAAD